ncbi:MAG: DUF4846 domain-containing protein [Bacteroidetes bacterium]|nr:DUF4846 domain-containing protein [Bacteroidota bacterium]
MFKIHILLLITFLLSCKSSIKSHEQSESNEADQVEIEHVIIDKVGLIQTPDNYERQTIEPNSFADYLRNLPLKTENNIVYLFDGTKKFNQSAQYKVVKMDVGDTDLQQCADAVMRLRAEYLYEQQNFEDIHFNFTSGDKAKWIDYAEGFRPNITGNHVSWAKTSSKNYSYSNFRKYMDLVFNYAGTYSLNKELKKVNNPLDIKAGDVFIQGGFPGHAIIVLDIAIHKGTGEKIFMLAQSYMPAQEIHVLVNPNDEGYSPWYKLRENEDLLTPEWTFRQSDLKSF